MSRFSVWNAQTKAYDYYESAAPGPDPSATAPPHLRRRELGTPITQAGWPLPAGARWVGRGNLAQGQVSTPLGAMPEETKFLGGIALGLGVLALLAWRKL